MGPYISCPFRTGGRSREERVPSEKGWGRIVGYLVAPISPYLEGWKQRLNGIVIWTRSRYVKRPNTDGGLVAGFCNDDMVRWFRSETAVKWVKTHFTNRVPFRLNSSTCKL
ncbi:hypothetical protein SADUNF_Sadunf16G0197900 [Salix dunnii]|uniref:Uncharacterized protein n=1 Tax=Salix dunnii TaxID=1413687 RepID=A0A835MM94_9ROSI|nr:hypothetical protein SADUNF_Sadunf16G0197900 [Salix dunnii]